MDDDTLRRRLDAALFLLAGNAVLLLKLVFDSDPDFAVGVLVLGTLVGYGLRRSD